MFVVFRADASVSIGSGHVMRCLTLADELTREGHQCHFVCRNHEGHLGDLIAGKGHGLTLLSSENVDILPADATGFDNYTQWLGVHWQEDARETLDVLTPWKPDWLVVDHYALDAEWEGMLLRAVQNIMVIDDLANRSHNCTILLDQNLGRSEKDYQSLVPEGCLKLIGPDNALLRPEFAELREISLKRRNLPELKRILISLGGVDRTNVTSEVLSALEESSLPSSTELDIVMGSAAPYISDIRKKIEASRFRSTLSVNVTDMAERMCLADLSIGAAGGTSWERCCLGLPAILVVLAENQMVGAMTLEAFGAAMKIDNISQLSEILSLMLLELSEPERLEQMSKATACIADGHGVLEVSQSMAAIGRTNRV